MTLASPYLWITILGVVTLYLWFGRLTAEEITQEWLKGCQAKKDKLGKKFDELTVNPMEQAVAAKSTMVNNFLQSMQDGTYESGCRRMSLAELQRRMRSKGLANYLVGVKDAVPAVTEFQNWRIPVQASIDTKLRQTPRGDFEQNMSRARVQAESMHQQKYKKNRRMM